MNRDPVPLIIAIVGAIALGLIFWFDDPKYNEAYRTASDVADVMDLYTRRTADDSLPKYIPLATEYRNNYFTNKRDPWGMAYHIYYPTEYHAMVRSSGPDKDLNTEDDIVVLRCSFTEEYFKSATHE